ncbi:MAG: primosomal protein N' [Bdellovibrionaceae bacterium]|nr:primosomal protein N' [Pseudobdellovibrionaceae bacterium]|tara:strand:- start:244570 stop:246621 length:2052 start_codon:yes stop_codon:yes gene_type:complete
MAETSDPTSVQVAVNAPIGEPLSYARGSLEVSPGQSVKVPLGKRSVSGLILDKASTTTGEFKIKPIQSINDERPILPHQHMRWLKWLSDYYLHPMGQIAEACFPPLKKQGRKDTSDQVLPQVELSQPPVLTEGQEECYKSIASTLGTFKPHLLFGVTGSGKTEVYLHLIHQVLERGERALVLVPEISLTPQLVERFLARFPNEVAVIHSGLTDRERTDQWWSVIDGRKRILVGARSALFCPIENLGIIIVDEEHDSSFKQDEKLKYHGRDSAVMLGHFNKCPVVLGSATPSLESWSNATEGKYQLQRMPHRVGGRSLPDVSVINMRDIRRARKDPESTAKTKASLDLPFWLSEPLYDGLQATLERGDQAALFLNRRGMAQTVQCIECGYVHECPNCSISLTLHHHSELNCHYCDYGIPKKDECPSCKEPGIQAVGLGTELVEEGIQKLFPDAVVARADRDEITHRTHMEDLIHRVERGEVDVLVGTQMIAKGLDFPKLNLVGLVMADVGFNMPDFRASERSFQLLTQVSGRAGRHSEDPGQVFIQTYNPDHESIRYAINADYEGFAQYELNFRKDLHYPPFGKIVCLRIQGVDLGKTEDASHLLQQRAEQLQNKFKDVYGSLQLLGPAPAPLSRIRGKFRFHFLIKSTQPQILQKFCRQLLSQQKWLPSGTKVLTDIDPLNML